MTPTANPAATYLSPNEVTVTGYKGREFVLIGDCEDSILFVREIGSGTIYAHTWADHYSNGWFVDREHRTHVDLAYVRVRSDNTYGPLLITVDAINSAGEAIADSTDDDCSELAARYFGDADGDYDDYAAAGLVDDDLES